MYKPCSFDRERYLEFKDAFESASISDASEELCEFDSDAESLAWELAYTRYYLAKAEKENEKMSDDQMKQDVKILCEKIMGTAWDCLTKEEWKDIESRAFSIGHWPQIINA